MLTPKKVIGIFLFTCLIATGIFFAGWSLLRNVDIQKPFSQNQTPQKVLDSLLSAQSFHYQLNVESTLETTAPQPPFTQHTSFDCFIDLKQRSQSFFDQTCRHNYPVSFPGFENTTITDHLSYDYTMSMQNNRLITALPESYDNQLGVIAYFENRPIDTKKIHYLGETLPDKKTRDELTGLASIIAYNADYMEPIGVFREGLPKSESKQFELRFFYRILNSLIPVDSYEALLTSESWTKKQTVFGVIKTEWENKKQSQSVSGTLSFEQFFTAFEPTKIITGVYPTLEETLSGPITYTCSIPEANSLECRYTLKAAVQNTIVTERYSDLNNVTSIPIIAETGDIESLSSKAFDLFKAAPPEKQKAFLDDADGDGLNYKEERIYNLTNLNSQDTDGDGYTDKQEVDSGFNPLGPGKKLENF